MIKLFYISHDSNSLSIHAREIIRHLVDANVSVRLFCPRGALADFGSNDLCRAVRVEGLGGAPGAWGLSYQIRLAVRLLSVCREEGWPDLIYCRQQHAGLLAILLARILRIPYFAEVNGIVSLAGTTGHSCSSKLKVLMEGLCFHMADVLIVPSVHLKKRVARRYRIRPADIEVVQNGANEALFSPEPDGEEPCRDPDRPFTVGFVGSMGSWQGIGALKTAILLLISQRSDIRFLIVGDYAPDADHGRMASRGGQASADISRFMENYDLKQKLDYVGMKPYELTADYMRKCDVLLAPYSRDYLEFGGGSPMKLYAYLACGKPVIVSDLGEVTDAPALRRNGAACLIPPDDPQALAEAVLMLKRDPEKRTRLGENGRLFVLTYRKWRDSARQILKIFDQRFGPSLYVTAISAGEPGDSSH